MRRLALAAWLAAPQGALCAPAAVPGAVSVATAAVTDDDFERLLKSSGEAVPARFTVSVPQTELRVSLDGFAITPAMGLTTAITFYPGRPQAAARGELVALESEAAEATRAALDAGFAISGVRHALVRESPKVLLIGVERAAGGAHDGQAGRGPPVRAHDGGGLPGRARARGAARAEGASGRGRAALRFRRARRRLGRVSGRDGAGRRQRRDPRPHGRARVVERLSAGGFEIAALDVVELAGEAPVARVRFWRVGPAAASARALADAIAGAR